MGSCSSDCGSCSENCASRKPTKEELLEPANPYSKIKKVIGIVSGKGGVGKSLVTSYMSVLMNKKGYKTAILDADVTGPSIPKAFGVKTRVEGSEFGIIPAQSKEGIKMMSVNLLLDSEVAPVVWRGPVIAGTVKQFWSEVCWGEVDYMFVDMPPGTGDVPLTVFQSLPLDGIIIVTSPQDLVSMIVEKAVNMANAMDIPILGIVENYSYMLCGNCGEKLSVFGESKVDDISKKYGMTVLGKLPIDPKIAKAVDAGEIEKLEGNWLDSSVEYLEQILEVEDEETQTIKNVKVAVPTDEDGNVFQHFGKTEKFTIYQIEDGILVSKYEKVSTEGGHDKLGGFLKSEGVNVVLCGGIGQGAMEVLFNAGIKVLPGTTGDINVAVSSYLDGTLIASEGATCDHHDHEEGHTCGTCGSCCH